jgi:serine/threonine protein kinase
MSPEQAQGGRNIDARSDQYSIGVILYECVTAQRPIQEAALYQQIQRVAQGDFAAPRSVNPNIPVPFSNLILRAMARRPADRYPSTRLLGHDLLAFASERIRANYAEELSQDELQETRPLGPPSENAALENAVTWRQQTRQPTALLEEAPRRSQSVRRVAAVALPIGMATAVLWQISTTLISRLPETAPADRLATRASSARPSPVSTQRDVASSTTNPELDVPSSAEGRAFAELRSAQPSPLKPRRSATMLRAVNERSPSPLPSEASRAGSKPTSPLEKEQDKLSGSDPYAQQK